MKMFHGFLASLRNARYLMFPSTVPTRPLKNGSVMTGVFPDSELWNMLYGSAGQLGRELHWRKFKRRHEIAEERATLYRNLVINEAPGLVSSSGSVPVSLRRPEIILAGVIGGSMRGAGISYMDIVALYPVVGDLSVEMEAEGRLDADGNTVWTDFTIDLGDGTTLRNGDIGMFKYKDDVVNEAKKKCPDDMIDWVTRITKIRRVEAVKRTPDGETLVCVSTHRETKEMGDDHMLSGLLGRAFSHFDVATYEARIRKSGHWNDMSIAARYPHFIGPNSDWEKDFAHLNADDRSLVESALLGDTDPFEIRAVAILNEMFEQALDIAS